MYSAIKFLRKKLSITQKDLADRLAITRQSLTKYENDPSTLTANNVKKLANILGTDYSTIIDNKPITDETIYEEDDAIADSIVVGSVIMPKEINENDTSFLLSKFNQIMIYLTTEVGAKPNIGRATICYILFLIEADYFKTHCQSLFGTPFIKTNEGPLIYEFDKTIDKMEQDGLIESYTSSFFKGPTTKYIPVITPILDALTSDEVDFINREITKYSEFTSEELLLFVESNICYKNAELNKEITFTASL